MKIRNIFMSLLAVIAVAVSCTEEKLPQLEELQVTPSIVGFPMAGTQDGPVTLTVEATSEWSFAAEFPDWITKVEADPQPVDGVYPAGKTTFKFWADALESEKVNHEMYMEILVGDKIQHILFKQGVQSKVPVPLKEIVENGIEGATYYVDATISAIVNGKYGNLILLDNLPGETGVLDIYGTLNSNGEEGKFSELGLSVGDRIIAHGPFKPYNGKPQLKNITVDEIFKSLVQLDKNMDKFELEKDAQTIEIKLKKVAGSLEVEPTVDWVHVLAININGGAGSVKLSIDANNDVKPRSTELKIISRDSKASSTVKTEISQKGNMPPAIKVAEAITKVGEYVAINGHVVALHKKGFMLSDGTDVIYAYVDGMPSVALGKNVTVCGTVGNYKSHYQIKDPVVLEQEGETAVTHPSATPVTKALFDEIAAEGNNITAKFVTVQGQPTGKYGDISVDGLNVSPYQISDDFKYPADWEGFNDVILEGYTVQALPASGNFSASLRIVVTSVKRAAALELPFAEDFNKDFGGFTVQNVLLPEGETSVWSHGAYKSKGYIKASGHYGGKGGSDKATEALVISPKIAISKPDAVLTFQHCGKYFKGADATEIQAKFMADVSVVARVAGTEEWTKLEVTGWGTGSAYDYVSSGEVSLAAFSGKEIQFAFRYTSSASCAGTWQIQDVAIN